MVMMRVTAVMPVKVIKGARSKQRGVALITVMLVFVLVAVIATEMLRRSQLSLRSVGNLIDTRQAYYYALGGEAFARQVLAKDAIEHGTLDTLTETWAKTKEQPPFDIEHGNMQVEINDLQGRFNLNNAVEEEGLQQFRRLLNALQLDPKYANEWRGWISEAAPAEGDPDAAAPLAPGQPETDISALRLLPSMTPQDYAKLAPHVAVLPRDTGGGVSKLNINTADEVVLQTLVSSTLSAQIAAKQNSGGLRNVEDVGLDPSIAALSSNFFEVVVTVNYANRWQRVRTVLERKREASGRVEMVVRSRVRSPLIDDIEL